MQQSTGADDGLGFLEFGESGDGEEGDDERDAVGVIVERSRRRAVRKRGVDVLV